MNVGIAGLGMMGGTIAWNMHWRHTVHGFIYDEDINELVKSDLFETISHVDSLSSRLDNLEILFLCSPVDVIKKQLIEISKVEKLSNKLIITDIGSTKQEITLLAYDLFNDRDDITFIGGHPMVGSEKTGFENRQEGMFENKTYFLIPNSEDAMNTLQGVLRISFLCFIKQIDHVNHDQIMALTSHLPQLLSTLLVNQLSTNDHHSVKDCIGSGFKDMTRLANSDYSVWKDIFRSNGNNLNIVIDEMIETLQSIRENDDTLEEIFNNVKKYNEGEK